MENPTLFDRDRGIPKCNPSNHQFFFVGSSKRFRLRVSQDLRGRVGPGAHRGACFTEAGADGLVKDGGNSGEFSGDFMEFDRDLMGVYKDFMGFSRDFMGVYKDFIGFYSDFMGFYSDFYGI